MLIPMLSNLPSYEEKKFCVLMTHRLTGDRAQLIRFFETKPFEEFDCYGFNPILNTDRYKGQIPGHPTSHHKLDILKNYRFCICFENDLLNGYISEKIFSAFAAGCVPIYLGASNITQYIPTNCFIDRRDFDTDNELCLFLSNLTEDDYNLYISNIKAFLKTKEAKMFSMEEFTKVFTKAVEN